LAQTGTRIPRLGSLHIAPFGAPQHLALRDQPRQMGFIDGRTIVYDREDFGLRRESFAEHAANAPGGLRRDLRGRRVGHRGGPRRRSGDPRCRSPRCSSSWSTGARPRPGHPAPPLRGHPAHDRGPAAATCHSDCVVRSAVACPIENEGRDASR
jgi:hypothetical protein